MTTTTAILTPDGADESTHLLLWGKIGDSSFERTISDPDVLHAISRFDEPGQAVESLLRIGACGFQATVTGTEIRAVRAEIDRVIDSTVQTVEGLQGHVSDTVGENGPLDLAIRGASGRLVTALNDALVKQADVGTPGTFLSSIKTAVTDFSLQMLQLRKGIAEDVDRTASSQAEALRKAVAALSNLEPDSALGTAFARIDKRLQEFTAAFASSQATEAERRRSTAKGQDYETLVAEEVGSIALAYGDRAERTGNQPGQVILKRSPSRRGDVTCTIGEGSAIVVEAMDRDAAQLTAKALRDELVEAMKNRGAQAGVAVISGLASVVCGQPLMLLGPESWAVVLDKDEPNPIALQIAYKLARDKVMATSGEHKQVDFDALKRGVEHINSKLSSFARLKLQLANIVRSGETATADLGTIEREVREAIFEVLDSLESEARES